MALQVDAELSLLDDCHHGESSASLNNFLNKVEIFKLVEKCQTDHSGDIALLIEDSTREEETGTTTGGIVKPFRRNTGVGGRWYPDRSNNSWEIIAGEGRVHASD